MAGKEATSCSAQNLCSIVQSILTNKFESFFDFAIFHSGSRALDISLFNVRIKSRRYDQNFTYVVA